MINSKNNFCNLNNNRELPTGIINKCTGSIYIQVMKWGVIFGSHAFIGSVRQGGILLSSMLTSPSLYKLWDTLKLEMCSRIKCLWLTK